MYSVHTYCNVNGGKDKERVSVTNNELRCLLSVCVIIVTHNHSASESSFIGQSNQHG